MRLILDIDSNNGHEKSKDIFDVITEAFPKRMVSLNTIDESNENQFYCFEEPMIASLKAHHESVKLDDNGRVLPQEGVVEGTHDRDAETMSYNQFLFLELLQVHNESFKVLPYDIMFEEGLKYYKEYDVSEYNDVDYSDYVCMENFIEDSEKVFEY